MLNRTLRRGLILALQKVGYTLQKVGYNSDPIIRIPDEPEWIREVYKRVQEFTMTSPERIASLCHAIEYIHSHKIPGDIVECGVWRGGSMIAAAMTLMRLNDTQHTLYLFDTFQGMSPPTAVDRASSSGISAAELLANSAPTEKIWAVSSLDETRHNLAQTGYPDHLIQFVKGRVEETLPGRAPQQVALLRLDTDWYESTRHELIHLFPRLVPGGVLIIDDYGYWKGAKKAVDEYIQENQLNLFLHRIDYTGRIALKS
jgi:O-methyltransferase